MGPISIASWDAPLGFQDQYHLKQNAPSRMPPLEHSAILLTFIKLPFVVKIFVLSIFEWPFYTGFTVPSRRNIKLTSVLLKCYENTL